MENWVTIGIDDDGTEAYLDEANILRDLERTSLFRVCLKHVPREASRTYAELLQAVKTAKRKTGKVSHVKQVVEIDFAKDASRNLHLVVCDRGGGIIDVINFRYPDWLSIERGSIVDKVRDALFNRFPDATGGSAEPLKFNQPRLYPKPEREETSNAYCAGAQVQQPIGKLRLEKSDL